MGQVTSVYSQRRNSHIGREVSRHGDTDEKLKDSTVGLLIVNVLAISSFLSVLSEIKHTLGAM